MHIYATIGRCGGSPDRARLISGEAALLLGKEIAGALDITVGVGKRKFKIGQVDWESAPRSKNHHDSRQRRRHSYRLIGRRITYAPICNYRGRRRGLRRQPYRRGNLRASRPEILPGRRSVSNRRLPSWPHGEMHRIARRRRVLPNLGSPHRPSQRRCAFST